ncbi:D-alanine--D-alanine ligase [Paenibacillus eucommiae]|uniref:D-alanine--D-alanine ligase n=1 Tax=Paenibacillus eucommiae TaxID=1355755 RepID=A0ABS4IN62_9BACL|nr:D-alanine--D-alanine ligase [Paenibacillus eucommiae]MBP1989001.1 D-alanine-D-alanine ligase [Paenibacillus eucommiae]
MKTNLYVLYGGKSAEHEVSLLTALTVINMTDKTKYQVYPIYVNPRGVWGSIGKVEHPLASTEDLRCDLADCSVAASIGEVLTRFFRPDETNIVFPVIHGTHGEDGTLQGMLEMLNVPYVGNGVLSSAVGMDKVMMRDLFAATEIPQMDYISFIRHEWDEDAQAILNRIEQTIGYPCYVKPANLGSSVGINRCTDPITLDEAIKEAFQYDRKLLVEKEITGREIQLAVIGNDHPIISVAGEFIRDPGFFDYAKKYKNGMLVQRIPADISSNVYAEMSKITRIAYRTLDGSGLMRVDFFVTDNEEIYLGEVNTLPGFTKISMFPTLWEQTDGTTYQQLIERLIDYALKRHKQKQSITYGRDQA